MFNKMSQAQRLVLQATARREDRLLELPANLRGAAAKTFGGKLIEAGWVREVKATNGAPVWRREAASGEAYALKLTPKGVRAVATASEATDGAENSSVPPATKKSLSKAPKRGSASLAPAPAKKAAGDSRREFSPTVVRAPRATSKLGRVIGILVADTRATIGELTAATGWLEHTTRAALTGLRHRGYALSLTKQERDGASVYRIVVHFGEAA